MKSTSVLLFTFLAALSLPAQEPAPNTSEKGAVPKVQRLSSGITRAVVIGISNYADERIPDLQYAHRDAAAFAAWLSGPAGGSVPAEHIQLYTNEQATVFQIGYAIGEITRASKAGDRAIIYLSGHGDAETDGDLNLGFFLAYDSPPNVYWGNALNLRDLQYLTNSMSKKGVQVLLISDACRSGKLAGSEIGGAQATAGQLATQFNNAILLLSCQPDEFSHESEQWGGGRGLFSYHLENALYGLADQNEDLTVDLRELRNHLEEKVPEEAAPNKQTPVVQGPVATRITTVDMPTLAQHQVRTRVFNPEIKDTGGKTLEQFPDSLLYERFLAALEAGNLMAPAGASANDYYEMIVANPEWEPYHGQVKRKFVVALADEAQIVVNKLLRTDPAVADDAFPGRVRYTHLPAYLARAADILGENHYMYRYLKAKQYFFEAKTYMKTQYPDLSPDSLYRLSDEVLNKALVYDPEAAYLHLEKGLNHYWKGVNYPLAVESFKKAMALSPTWVLALYYLGRIQAVNRDMSGIDYLKQAVRRDSTFLPAYERLGYNDVPENSALWRNEYVRRMQEWIERDSNSIPATYYRYMGLTLCNLNRHEDAEKYLLKGAEMTNWEDPMYYKNLGMMYEDQGRRADMCRCYEKLFEVYPKNWDHYFSLAVCGKYPKVRETALQWYLQDTTQLGGLDALYLLYESNHQPDLLKKVNRKSIEVMETTGIYDQDLFTKGNYYMWCGDPDKAEKAFGEYIRQEEASGDQDRIVHLGGGDGPYHMMAAVKFVQGDWKAAEAWWLKQDALSGDTTGNGWRQWIAFSRGQMNEVRRLDSLAEIRNQAPVIRVLFSDMLFYATVYGLIDLAIHRLENARQFHPDDTPLLYHLARLYLEQKDDYARGVPLLERAVQLDSTFAVARYHLAAAYAHLGRDAAALEHLEKALETGFEDWEEMEQDGRWGRLGERAGYEKLLNEYRRK